MAAWSSKVPLGMEVGLGAGNFVFDGDPAIPRKNGTPTPTQFLAHVYCGHGRPSQLLLSSCAITKWWKWHGDRSYLANEVVYFYCM